jgi:translation initiation factor 2 subunit 2
MNEYDQKYLLDRLYNQLTIIKGNNIADNKNDKDNIKIPAPIFEVGSNNREMCIKNYQQLCDSINRDYECLKNYILEELKTTGSLNINKQLIIKGKYKETGLILLIKNFIRKFVICHSCKTMDTNLEKTNKKYIINCNNCKASNNVII